MAEERCRCEDGTYATRTCNGDGSVLGACGCARGPAEPEGCVPSTDQSYSACYLNNVVWHDDCDQPGAVLEACVEGTICVRGQCTQDSQGPPEPEGCVPANAEAYTGCLDNAVVWYDDCDQVGAVVEACGAGAGCVDSRCVDECTPAAGQYCRENAVTAHDSCGEPGDVVEACGAGQLCLGCDTLPCGTPPACVAAGYNGSWILRADPVEDDGCGPNLAFIQEVLDLEVADDFATGTIDHDEWARVLEFTGTADNGRVAIVESYTSNAPPSQGWAIEYDHLIDVRIVADGLFEGTYTYTSNPNNNDPCRYHWKITGTRL